MNLVILSYEYPPDTGFGGIGTYSFYHARAMARLGHRVHVIAGSREPGLREFEHDGVRVIRVRRTGWVDGMLRSADQRRCGWFRGRIQNAHSAWRGLHRVLTREAVDLVEGPECGGDLALASTLVQVPTAVRFHSPARLIMDMYDTPRIDRELAPLVEQIAINQATVRTSCSQFLADAVQRRMHVRPPIHVIPNGIDLQLFDRDEGIDVHARYGLPRQGSTIFFANRLEERKGVHLLGPIARELLPRHPDLTLVLAGADTYGQYANRLLPELRELGLADRVLWLGAIDLAHVRAVLKRITVFLIPSIWENCPYSAIEAMAAGRAIVSSDCGGMPELIRHGETGLLARSNDAPAFIDALGRMLRDRDLRTRCGAAARREVEQRLTDDHIARTTTDLYRRVLAGTGGS